MGYYVRSINRQGISSLSPVAMRFYKKSISYKHTRELEVIGFTVWVKNLKILTKDFVKV